MPYATETYPGNGVTTNFAITWGYLDAAHVSATVDGSSAAFTWLNPSTITISPAPANGTTVRISRNSSRGTRLVDFTNGESLTEYTLDLAMTQALYVAQEAFDASDAVMNTEALQDMVDAAEAAAALANASASNANIDATAASNSASAASASAVAAAASAVLADASADAAALSEAAAAGYASSALLKASNLSDLVSASSARTNLGLGTAAVENVGYFATAAQGALAASALQPASLVTTKKAKIVGDGTATYVFDGELLWLEQGTANTNGHKWLYSQHKSGAQDVLILSAINDAANSGSPAFTVYRTGATVNTVDIPDLTVSGALHTTEIYDAADTKGRLYMGAADWGAYILQYSFINARQFSNSDSSNLGATLTGTPTFDLSTHNRYYGTLTGSITPTFTPPDFPCTIRIMLTQGGSGSYTITYPSSVKWPADVTSAQKLLSTTAGKKDLLILDWDGTIYVANLMKDIG